MLYLPFGSTKHKLKSTHVAECLKILRGIIWVNKWQTLHKLKKLLNCVNNWYTLYTLKKILNCVNKWYSLHKLKKILKCVNKWYSLHKLKKILNCVNKWYTLHKLKKILWVVAMVCGQRIGSVIGRSAVQIPHSHFANFAKWFPKMDLSSAFLLNGLDFEEHLGRERR